MNGRLIRAQEAHLSNVSILALVSERDVSSETLGPPTSPAQTLLVFPDHKPQTNVTFHNGSVASGIAVQLLFWGDFWDHQGAGERGEIVGKVQELLAGPFFAALDQYGVAKPVYGGARTVTKPDPPQGDFDGGDVGGMVWDLIDDGVFPAPEAPGGFNAYYAMMPPGATLEGADAAHGARPPAWWMFWADKVLAGWSVWHEDADTMLASFSHEMVELTTDPYLRGWYNDDLDHKEGELSDLCEPHGWQTGFVGDVKVQPYWSARDQACVIPTHPLKVRIEGRISVDAAHEDGSGEKEYPFGGEGHDLCAVLPVCCFKGPYKWKSSKLDETASLQATASGFHAASLHWGIAGKPVSGSGSVGVTVGVTRQTEDGVTSKDEDVMLKYEQDGSSLAVTNDSVAGSFEVTVEALAEEGGLSASNGTTVQGARRVAHCVLPFRGQGFIWDEQLAKDREACNKASDELSKKTHKGRAKKIGPRDPGELRPHDRAILSNAGAWVSEDTLHAAEMALARAAALELSHPEDAAQLRHALLTSLGVPLVRDSV